MAIALRPTVYFHALNTWIPLIYYLLYEPPAVARKRKKCPTSVFKIIKIRGGFVLHEQNIGLSQLPLLGFILNLKGL